MSQSLKSVLFSVDKFCHLQTKLIELKIAYLLSSLLFQKAKQFFIQIISFHKIYFIQI